jgi:hypothetical protein
MSNWRDEEYRGGADGKISTSDRGKLGASEKEALAMQHRNRDVSRGTHAEVEARQAARAVDTAMKTPVHSTGANNGTPAAQRRGG